MKSLVLIVMCLLAVSLNALHLKNDHEHTSIYWYNNWIFMKRAYSNWYLKYHLPEWKDFFQKHQDQWKKWCDTHKKDRNYTRFCI